MNKRLCIIIYVLFVFVFNNSMLSIADEPEKVEKVVVTGIGINADKARQNAIRNAVEQVVGTYVSSDTMVQDSQLIKDEILSFSGGYVKESKLISTEKDDDIVKVKLEALVISTKLRRKVQSLNITIKNIDGDSLFGEAISKSDANVNASLLLNKIMSKFPQSAYNITIGKPEISSTNSDTNQTNISVPTTIKWDKTYLDELKTVLSQICKTNIKYVDYNKYFSETTKPDALPGDNIPICLITKSSASKDILDNCYMIDMLKLYSLQKENRSLQSYMSESKVSYGLIKRQNDLKLIFTFIAKNNEELLTIPYLYYENLDGETDNCKKQGFFNNMMCYNNGYMSLPNLFPASTSMSGESLILMDGNFKFNAQLSINTELLKQIKSIKVSIEPWQQ